MLISSADRTVYKSIQGTPQSTFTPKRARYPDFRNPACREFLMLDCAEVLLKAMFSDPGKANTRSPVLLHL
ncbi:MAG: hypothetical protein QM426_08950 [Euryarchaeota archaeon]|nr:hypothetical protein [Euryarchaeota archaeon]